MSITLRGWIDGELTDTVAEDGPDRWAIQSADSVEFTVGGYGLKMKQLPKQVAFEKIGVGAVLWEGAFVLSMHAASLPPAEFVGKRVIELGAGPGLVGILLSKMGARVTLTDLPSVLPIIEENITLNGCAGAGAGAGALADGQEARGSARAEALDWLRAEESALVGGQGGEGDWDWVVASDCVYFPELIDAFVGTLRGCMGPRTKAMVCFEVRSGAVRDRFLELIGEGFVAERVALGHLPPEYQREHVELYHLSLPP